MTSKPNDNWVELWFENIDELTPNPKKVPPDYYSSEELRKMGVECGTDCMVHKQNIIVNPTKLKLGSNVRIDAYCTISCGEVGINIGSHVHIAGYVSLFGGAGITVGDYASIASGAKVYSVSDDVMGRGMVGPCVPLEKRHLHKGLVVLEDYSVLCVNSVVMPRGYLAYGAVLLPFTVLNEYVPINTVWGNGFPKERKGDFV